MENIKTTKILNFFSKKSILLLCTLILVVGFFSNVSFANADLQGNIQNRLDSVAGDLGAGLGGSDVRLVIALIIRALLGFIGFIFLGMVVYAGFIWLFSGGNEMVTAKAIHTLQNAAIGLFIILISFAISSFIVGRLQKASFGKSDTSVYGVGCYGELSADSRADCETYSN